MTFHDSPTHIPDPEVVPKAKRLTLLSISATRGGAVFMVIGELTIR